MPRMTLFRRQVRTLQKAKQRQDRLADRTRVDSVCRAYQASDQMSCVCGRTYDVNDPDPPICPVTKNPARVSGRG